MPSVADLKRFVEMSPNDPFPLYGLAMQQRSEGALEEAIATFTELCARFPTYVPGHQQLAIALTRAGRLDDARAAYAAGIAAARSTGNRHAADEMQAALDELAG
jgi:Flp pilus assembly protein TadD